MAPQTRSERMAQAKGEALKQLTLAQYGVIDWHAQTFNYMKARAILDALITAALSLTEGPQGWQPLETAPKDGSAFRAYGESLIHPDFNPWGSVEACFDGERFIGAEWDGQHDKWNTVFLDSRATHWIPLPAPPPVPEGPPDDTAGAHDVAI